jgi:UDP-N-acetylglucosamine 2-epimerase (non-hydrolysing)
MTGLDVQTVLDSIPIATNKNDSPERFIQLVKDYFAPDVSDKVLKIIVSYTGFVNRRVWRKND